MPIDKGHVGHVGHVGDADQGGNGLGRGGSVEPRGAGWRVILVGRTGLDQVLRRVSGVELIRTRDSFDAIGELSDPIDDASPARAAVLVSLDAEPGEDGEGEELVKFIEALRMVDAGVKVIRVGEAHRMYDGSVSAGARADEVMAVIEGAVAMPRIEVVRVEKPVVDEQVVDEPGIDALSSESDDVSGRDTEGLSDERSMKDAAHDQENAREVTKLHQRVMAGIEGGAGRGRGAVPAVGGARGGITSGMDRGTDELVIRALGEGRSVIEPAVGLIRARTGREDISFARHGVSAGEDGVAVHTGGRVLGWLVCDDRSWMHGAGARVLGEHAVWLGSWLRLEEQQRALRLAAFTDELTGAWNRRYFSRFLDAAIEQARSARRTLTLLYFDIDDFKGYNDRYGHAAGDEILVETVRLLESVIRPGDKVCRIGGDEFVVIFYEPKGPRDLGSLPPESIYSLATRFQKQICEHRFPKLGDEACGTLTISGGLASFPWDGADGETLLSIADDLAMQSKRSGKNVITLGRGAEGECGVDCDRD